MGAANRSGSQQQTLIAADIERDQLRARTLQVEGLFVKLYHSNLTPHRQVSGALKELANADLNAFGFSIPHPD
ncbi:MAG TPA: hypothetical protein VI031_00255 [Pyrinomonadaceae bacterium]